MGNDYSLTVKQDLYSVLRRLEENYKACAENV
jgi:hypothetical protein